MNQWFSLSCDRYGHLTTALGGSSSKINRPREGPNSGQIALAPSVTQFAKRKLEKSIASDSLVQTGTEESPIRRILIPIDADHVKPGDLKPQCSGSPRRKVQQSFPFRAKAQPSVRPAQRKVSIIVEGWLTINQRMRDFL